MADEIKKGADNQKPAKPKKTKKSNKPNFLARSGKASSRFFKDFKGELKKIVWTSPKDVLKGTGIVLLVIAIVGLIIFAIDSGLTAGVDFVLGLAEGETTTAATTAATTSAATTTAGIMNLFGSLVG